MPETLDFRLRLPRGAGFVLEAEGRIPLDGVTALTGPSGSGKTTLLRALAGLEHTAGGQREIAFRGRSWDGASGSVPVEERRIGFVFQDPALFPHLDVAGNLAYGARRRGVGSWDAIVEALDLGALLPRPVAGLSGGEARRVALGRALASDPQILFLDEPMSGLDAARKAEFLPYVARAVGEARVPAIYVSHSADEVATLADRALGLAAGRLTGWQAPPMRLRARVTGPAPGGIAVEIEGAAAAGAAGVLAIPLRARPGEIVGLGLMPESLLVSRDHPGTGTALAVLPAERRDRALVVFGQRLDLPPGMTVPEGGRLWLSVLRVLPRPERGDSPD